MATDSGVGCESRGPDAVMTEAALATPRLRWGLGDAAVGYLVAVVGASVLGGAWLAASGDDELTLGGLAVAQIGLWTGLLGAPVIAAYRRGSGSLASDLGLVIRARDALVGVPVGLACQLILVPLVYLPLSPFLDTSSLSQPARDLTGRAEGVGFVALAVVVIGGASVVEELFFRGLLLRALHHRIGPAVATAGSASVFGFTHFQPLQFPALAAFGVVLAYLTLRAGRLGPAIWAHGAFNATTIVFLAMQR